MRVKLCNDERNYVGCYEATDVEVVGEIFIQDDKGDTVTIPAISVHVLFPSGDSAYVFMSEYYAKNRVDEAFTEGVVDFTDFGEDTFWNPDCEDIEDLQKYAKESNVFPTLGSLHE